MDFRVRFLNNLSSLNYAFININQKVLIRPKSEIELIDLIFDYFYEFHCFMGTRLKMGKGLSYDIALNFPVKPIIGQTLNIICKISIVVAVKRIRFLRNWRHICPKICQILCQMKISFPWVSRQILLANWTRKIFKWQASNISSIYYFTISMISIETCISFSVIEMNRNYHNMDIFLHFLL